MKQKKLTKAQQEKYIKNGKSQCPYCESDDIEGNNVEVDSDGCFQSCECHDCNSNWNDIYKFVGVEGGYQE